MFEKLRKYYNKLVVDYIYYKGKIIDNYHNILKNISVWSWLAKTKLQSARLSFNRGMEAIKKTVNKIIDSTIRFIDSIKKEIDILIGNHRINKIPKLEAKIVRLKEKVGFVE